MGCVVNGRASPHADIGISYRERLKSPAPRYISTAARDHWGNISAVYRTVDDYVDKRWGKHDNQNDVLRQQGGGHCASYCNSAGKADMSSPVYLKRTMTS